MRSLQRGLAAYAHILRRPGCSFTEVRRATGLSKAVTHRLLAALEESGFVWRTLSDGRYWPRSIPAAGEDSRAGLAERRLAEASVEPLLDLNAALVWPSDVFTFAAGRMRLLESSRRRSPFLMNPEATGREVDALPTAVGRAYLGALAPRARARALDRMRADGSYARQAAVCAEDPETAIESAGRQGHAFRDPAFLGQDGRDDGIQGLAVPIPGRRGPLGAVNVVWIRSAVAAPDARAAWLAPLRACAAAIARRHALL